MDDIDSALRDIEAIASRGEREHSVSQPAGGFFRDIVTVAREARAALRGAVPEAGSHPHDGYAYDGCKCVCCLNVRALQVPRAVPEAGSREGLRAALPGLDSLLVFDAPTFGQFIAQRPDVWDILRAALGDTQEPRPDSDAVVRALVETLTPWHGSLADHEDGMLRRCIDVVCGGASKVVPRDHEGAVVVRHRPGCAVVECFARVAAASPAAPETREPSSTDEEAALGHSAGGTWMYGPREPTP